MLSSAALSHADDTGILDREDAEFGGPRCALESAESASQLDRLSLKAQSLERGWKLLGIAPEDHRGLQVPGRAKCQLQPADQAPRRHWLRARQPQEANRQLQQARVSASVDRPLDVASPP